MTEYLKSSNPLGFLLGRTSVKNWLTSLKGRFRNIHHVWFGNLNDLGQYGVCITEAEYRYSLTKYFTLIKGSVVRAVQLKNEATGKGLLESGFQDQTFMLPAPIAQEKKKQ